MGWGMCMVRRRAGVQVAMSAGTFLLVALGCSGAVPAGVEWGTHGAFQACLDAQVKQWVAARVELVVNEDPAASNIDDRAVAAWTAQALETCTAKAGRGDRASEQLFARYMARWREHIDAAATEVRRRSRAD
jgi:hypothetical protein